MSYKKLLSIYLFLASIFNFYLLSEGWPSESVDEDYYKHFEGVMGQSSKIQMDIIKTGEKVEGYYFYEKYGKPIWIRGKIENKKMILEEFVDRKQSGVLEGDLTEDGTFKGIWKIDDKAKPVHFNVKEIYEHSASLNVYAVESSYLVGEGKNIKCKTRLVYLHPIEFCKMDILPEIKQIVSWRYFGDHVDITFDITKGNPKKVLEKWAENNIKSCPKNIGVNHEDIMEMAVLFNSDGILSLRYSSYEYSGQPHGYSSTGYLSIDLKEGRVIELKNIFKPGYETYLGRIITKKLEEKAFKKYNTRDLSEAGYRWHEEEAMIGCSFYLNRAGIGFYYDVYSIGPYVMGTTDIYIPFKEIKKNMFKKGSIVYDLIFKQR
jgi:hypothetical protein